MLQISEDEDGAEKIAVAVLQRRDREANRYLVSPARDQIPFAPRGLLPWRLTLVEQFDEPMFALEEVDHGLLYGLRRREFREHLGGFVEISNLSIAVYRNDAIFQAGKNLLPGDFIRRLFIALKIQDFHHKRSPKFKKS